MDMLTPELKKTYNLSKKEALELLKQEEVTESEQMLNKWARDGLIDSVFIAKGAPAGRGIRINQKSLEAFIMSKKGNITELARQLEEKDLENKVLKELLNQARKEIRELKESGVKAPKNTEIKITEVSLSADNKVLNFKYKRARHFAYINENKTIERIMKNTKGKGTEDVTEAFREHWDIIVKVYAEELAKKESKNNL